MIRGLTITPISSDPIVTVAEAKTYCACDVDTWDAEFLEWIKVATSVLQKFTGLAFVPSTVTGSFVIEGHEDYILLPYPNGAVVEGQELVGDRIYINHTDGDADDTMPESVRVIGLTYTTGVTEEWMQVAVKMYVADLFAQRGESDLTDWSANAKIRIGERAKQYAKSFISHGYWF